MAVVCRRYIKASFLCLISCAILFVVVTLIPRHERCSIHVHVQTESSEDVALALALPRVPVQFWLNNNKKLEKREACIRMPSIYKLQYNNLYWQNVYTRNGTFYLFGAYYDIRQQHIVRVLGAINRREPTVETFCQLWFQDLQSIVVKASKYDHVWDDRWGGYEEGGFDPYLISCPIPEEHADKVPVSVSLVDQPCNLATNLLKIFFNNPPPAQKKGFAVCVKGLDFPDKDLSAKLVEWVELLALVGVDDIFVYEVDIHPNISRVLQYYQQQGRVSVIPLTLPGALNIPGFQHSHLTIYPNTKMRTEVIPYNDCFYRNVYSYEYIAMLDIDEIIIPRKVKTWRELLETLPKSPETASYGVVNVFYLDELTPAVNIPSHMHMLRKVRRYSAIDNSTDPNFSFKCIHRTDSLLTLHNHYPLKCLSGYCPIHIIEQGDAQLQHYRGGCDRSPGSTCSEALDNPIQNDTSLWRYTHELVARTTKTLKRMGLLE